MAGAAVAASHTVGTGMRAAFSTANTTANPNAAATAAAAIAGRNRYIPRARPPSRHSRRLGKHGARAKPVTLAQELSGQEICQEVVPLHCAKIVEQAAARGVESQVQPA